MFMKIRYLDPLVFVVHKGISIIFVLFSSHFLGKPFFWHQNVAMLRLGKNRSSWKWVQGWPKMMPGVYAALTATQKARCSSQY